MYLRSAPLQNTPSTPESTTTRTLSSRASISPAWRRSCAVCTSSELNRSGRSIVMYPTASSTRVRMWTTAGDCDGMCVDLRSADAWQEFAFGFRHQATPESGVEDDGAD